MRPIIPEKTRLLDRLKREGFNVPEFVYIPARDFEEGNFTALRSFLDHYREGFKLIARSAHPAEEYYKAGTFDSLETYADVAGIKYARKRMIDYANSAKRLSIFRQQKFNAAPDIEAESMGVIVMPFIQGQSIMAKMVGGQWEFGYSADSTHRIHSEPYITNTPHDTKLLEISENIQKFLGFRCEIEYVIAGEGSIHVVQARDISHVETLERKESERLSGLTALFWVFPPPGS